MNRKCKSDVFAIWLTDIGRFQKSVEKQVQKNDEMDLRVVHHSCSYLNFIPFLCLLLKKATHAM